MAQRPEHISDRTANDLLKVVNGLTDSGFQRGFSLATGGKKGDRDWKYWNRMHKIQTKTLFAIMLRLSL